MLFDITKDDIRQSGRDRVHFIEDFSKKQLEDIESRIHELIEEFNGDFISAGFSPNSFCEFENIDVSVEPGLLPDGFAIGGLKTANGRNLQMPAILPFALSNATGFCLDDLSRDRMTDLLQLLAYRILVSIPIGMVNLHFVDLHSNNQALKLYNRLTDVLKGTVVSEKKEFKNLLNQVSDCVSTRNRTVLCDCNDMREYNRGCGEVQVQPYHFIFILDVHNGIDNDDYKRLYDLINNNNASHCGIYLFYTIDNKCVEAQQPATLSVVSELKKIFQISTLVQREGDMFKIKGSIYGDSFEQNYSICLDSYDRNRIDLESIKEYIGRKIREFKSKSFSFYGEYEEMMKTDGYWKSNTVDGISIPIGIGAGDKRVNFVLGHGTGDNHAILAGMSGSGKTVLLHNIICGGAMLYSPDELEMYLLDYGDGVSFAKYKNLPHVKVLSLVKDSKIADSVFENLECERKRRASLFKTPTEEYEKIEDYRKFTGRSMPRILFIVDEFHNMFGDNMYSGLAMSIKSNIEKCTKEWRKFGMHLLLCTQGFGNIPVSLSNITLRISFKIKREDCTQIFGVTGDNDAATRLPKYEAVLNNDNNYSKQANVFFKSAYLKSDDDRNGGDGKKGIGEVRKCVDFCSEIWEQKLGRKHEHFLFSGHSVSNLGENELYLQSYSMDSKIPNEMRIFVGRPCFLRAEDEYLLFKRIRGSHLLICGMDTKAALSTMAFVNYQIFRQIVNVGGLIYATDYFASDLDYSMYLKNASKMSGIEYLDNGSFEKKLDEVVAELSCRKKKKEEIKAEEKNDNPFVPMFISIGYIQGAENMRMDFMSSSPMTSKIHEILESGPDYGVHLVVYATSYADLCEKMDPKRIVMFGNRIILKGGVKQYEKNINPEQIANDSLGNGSAIIVTTSNKTTTYEQDPLVLYNTFSDSDIEDDVLDYIFSIYNDK